MEILRDYVVANKKFRNDKEFQYDVFMITADDAGNEGVQFVTTSHVHISYSAAKKLPDDLLVKSALFEHYISFGFNLIFNGVREDGTRAKLATDYIHEDHIELIKS